MTALTLRKSNDDPPAYRVRYDGVEVGSISLRNDHISHRDFWSWGVDTMPLMDRGGRPPEGSANSLDEAKEAFREAFTKWRAVVGDDAWARNRDHKAAASKRKSPAQP